jgi:hypothetical protein
MARLYVGRWRAAHVYTLTRNCADLGGLRAVRQRVAALFGPFLRWIIVNAFLKWCVTA